MDDGSGHNPSLCCSLENWKILVNWSFKRADNQHKNLLRQILQQLSHYISLSSKATHNWTCLSACPLKDSNYLHLSLPLLVVKPCKCNKIAHLSEGIISSDPDWMRTISWRHHSVINDTWDVSDSFSNCHSNWHPLLEKGCGFLSATF